MIHKKLGKIAAASFGMGGYQDCMIGLSLSFSMDGTAVGTFVGGWGIKRSESTEWTEDDRLREIGKAGMKLGEILQTIRKQDVSDLVGIPVEVTLDGNRMTDWRLLTEVL